MLVRVLGTYGYRGRFDEEWNDSALDPTWEDIEAALRRLDAGEFAGVVLHVDDHRPGEAATEYFDVHGGPGGYIFGFHVGGRHLNSVAPEATEPGENVEVCQRDQGVWVPACHVCHDLELIVEAARWFFRTAEPHPDDSWGKFGRTTRCT